MWLSTYAAAHLRSDSTLPSSFRLNHRQFFIPRGFAHGFSVLTDDVVFQYKCDNFYAPQSEGAIAWDDAALAIDWRIPADKVILSEKDKCHPLLKDAEWLFDYNDNLYE